MICTKPTGLLLRPLTESSISADIHMGDYRHRWENVEKAPDFLLNPNTTSSFFVDFRASAPTGYYRRSTVDVTSELFAVNLYEYRDQNKNRFSHGSGLSSDWPVAVQKAWENFEKARAASHELSLKYVIISEVDAPSKNMVCERLGDPYNYRYYYMSRLIDPRLRRCDGMRPVNPRPVEDFGFNIVELEYQVDFELSGVNIATYSDGQPRRWQEGEKKFSLPRVQLCRI